jgi:hypothetical protein
MRFAFAAVAVGTYVPVYAQKTTTELRAVSPAFKTACAIDHHRFCAAVQPGTNVDEACLRQNHVSLRLECRKALAVKNSERVKRP